MLTAGSCVTPGGSLRSSLMLRNSFQNFRASLRRLVTTAATGTNPQPGPGASRVGDILTHREAWQTVEGFRHTVLYKSSRNRRTMVHEFVHLCLSHHAWLPLWLNEGAAAYLAGELIDPQSRGFDRDAAIAQPAFWTPATIQGFWSGRAFHEEETEKMSYNLAELFVGLLWREFGDLGRFIIAARRDDSGESAAREHLGISLGEVTAAVLGEGDWQPEPPARAGGA